MFLVQKRREERKDEKEGERQEEEGERSNVSKSLEGRHMAGDDTAAAAAALLVVVLEDINYGGVTLLKNIIGEKRKRPEVKRKEEEEGEPCTAPLSPPPLPRRPCLSSSSLSLAFSDIFFPSLLSLKYVPHKGAFHFSVKCGNL